MRTEVLRGDIKWNMGKKLSPLNKLERIKVNPCGSVRQTFEHKLIGLWISWSMSRFRRHQVGYKAEFNSERLHHGQSLGIWWAEKNKSWRQGVGSFACTAVLTDQRGYLHTKTKKQQLQQMVFYSIFLHRSRSLYFKPRIIDMQLGSMKTHILNQVHLLCYFSISNLCRSWKGL